MTTTIQKWGNSQGVRIPKMLLDSVKWAENEQIMILVDNDKLIIEKAKDKKRKNIKELFADYKGDYKPINIDWGEPKGEEIW
jgi:hypothetical protein